MPSSPDTYALLLAIGLLLVIMAVTWKDRRWSRPTGPVCPARDCGYANAPNARYCARCGRPLTDSR